MFDATTNKRGDLLIIHFSERVNRDQTGQCLKLLESLMPKVQPGFTVITDMGRLTHMDFDCSDDVGKLMDLCSEAKVAHICRVIPNPDVDIGWNILSQFHYDKETVRINTYTSFYKAMKALIDEEE